MEVGDFSCLFLLLLDSCSCFYMLRKENYVNLCHNFCQFRKFHEGLIFANTCRDEAKFREIKTLAQWQNHSSFMRGSRGEGQGDPDPPPWKITKL